MLIDSNMTNFYSQHFSFLFFSFMSQRIAKREKDDREKLLFEASCFLFLVRGMDIIIIIKEQYNNNNNDNNWFANNQSFNFNRGQKCT